MLSRGFGLWFGRLLDALAAIACVLLFAMTLVICLDVLFRNAPLIESMRGVPGSNEFSESALYLITMLTAPWLLRRGQHIRVDIVLRVIPKRIAWYCEWLVDIIGLACCIVLFVYGAKATIASYNTGAMTIKSIVWPEWWLLAPLPITFILLAIEMLFRMQRLYAGPRAPREDAVTAG